MQQRAKNLFRFGVLTAVLLAGASACGPSRTTAATQPTPAAFDPSQSDEKALGLVDTMLETLGGAEQWPLVKELRWEVKYQDQDQLQRWDKHAWDRWNGRHRFDRADMKTYQAAVAEGRPQDTKWLTVMYDLFNRTEGIYAEFAGNEVMASDRTAIVEDAYKQWQEDSYQLSMLYKLRDPGVKLKYMGEIQSLQGMCTPACIEIQVTFVPEVGKDTYYVAINKDSNLPEIISKQMSGTSRLGFSIAGWTEVSGLKLPSKFKNLGAEQTISMENIQASTEPDDSLYIPTVK